MKKEKTAAKTTVNIQPYLNAFYQGNKLCWGIAMTFTLLTTVHMIVISWGLGEVLDAAAALDSARLLRLIWFCGGFLLFAVVTDLGESRFKSLFFRRAMRQYKSLAFRRLSEKSISAFSQENTGRYISVLTTDVITIQSDYLDTGFLLVYHSLQFCLALIMMLSCSPLLTLSVILFSVLPMAASLLLGAGLTPRERAVSDQNEKFVSLAEGSAQRLCGH